MELLLVAITAYLIGSTPTAYLIVRLLTGRDLRTLGSGNVGVMNTARQVGLPAGMIAFIAEGAKGIAAIVAARIISGTPEADALGALFAVIGVNYPVFLGFHGGRGTTIVVFITLALLWPLVVFMGFTWLVIYRARHDNFIATRVNILALPFVTAALVWALDGNWHLIWLASLGSLVTLYKHRRETDDHFIAAAEHAQPSR